MASASAPIKAMRAWLYSSTTASPGGLSKNLSLSSTAAHPRPTNPPQLLKNELLIRVRAASLNPIDYKLPELPYGMSRAMIATPASPATDFAGIVTAIGPHVADIKSNPIAVGDPVFGRLDPSRFGSLGEYIVAQSAGCVRMPDGVSFEDASGIGSAAQAAFSSIVPNVPQPLEENSAANKGFRIFINGGSGGTGTFGIQIARLLGCHVTVSCSSRNVELCKRLGADEVIDYTKGDLIADLKAQGLTYSLIVDNIGSPADLYKAADDFLLPTGKFVQVGSSMTLAGMGSLTSRMMKPSFLGGGSRKYELLVVKNNRETLARIGAWLAAGTIQVVKEEVYAFEDAPAAFEKLREGRTRGKIIVRSSD